MFQLNVYMLKLLVKFIKYLFRGEFNTPNKNITIGHTFIHFYNQGIIVVYCLVLF